MAASIDAVSQGSVIAAASITIAHTVGSGSNRALYVFAVCPNSGDYLATATVTYGGVSMGAAIASALTASNYLYVWRLLAPASGTANIVITPSSSAYIHAFGVSMSGVDQTTPNGTAASATSQNTTPCSTSVTLGAGGMAIDMFSARSTASAVAPVAGQTQLGTEINAGVGRSGASYKAGSGSTSMGWTFPASSGGSWLVVPVNAATVTGVSGDITTDAAIFSGSAGPGAFATASITTDASTFSGSAGIAPGTINGDPICNASGSLLIGVTIPKVTFIKLSDMSIALAMTNQTTNGSGLLPITNAALVPGATYLRVFAGADAGALTDVGIKAYVAT